MGTRNQKWLRCLQGRTKYLQRLHTEYEITRQRLRDSEEKRRVNEMYKGSELPGSHDRNGSDIYDPMNHARLYGISKNREEAAYR